MSQLLTTVYDLSPEMWNYNASYEYKTTETYFPCMFLSDFSVFGLHESRFSEYMQAFFVLRGEDVCLTGRRIRTLNMSETCWFMIVRLSTWLLRKHAWVIVVLQNRLSLVCQLEICHRPKKNACCSSIDYQYKLWPTTTRHRRWHRYRFVCTEFRFRWKTKWN